MAELIYSVRNIFSTDNSECCLIEYDADKYHIAAYQRGYKWASDEYGAVTALLNDLWDAFNAFENQERREYYLQYITLKRISKNRYFEVIDGQQRLTTISILLSIMSMKLEMINLVKDKLDYAIRANFFTKHVYDRNKLKVLLNQEWVYGKGLLFPDGEIINSQDVYYIFNAAKKINTFCLEMEANKKLKSFYDFVLDKVKIIVNAVENISSEKVFSNLNSNKVPLTEVELIKGLLLTKLSRLHDKMEGKKHFREILEMRMSLGRQWDEITRWCNHPDIKLFFFKGEEGMNRLLTLIAINNGYSLKKNVTANDYPLFNFYHKFGRPKEMYQQILKFYSVFKDWYADDKLYNLLGYLFFVRGSNMDIKGMLPKIDLPKSHLLEKLQKEVKEMIPVDPEHLFYNNDQDNEIHRTLLAISVFSGQNSIRFNYHRFIAEKWTLEHIFPQTPEGKGQKLENKDKDLIIEMLGDKATESIKQLLAKETRTTEEKEIYQAALKGIGHLNSIGNICLLTDKDNISNGCGFFYEKRTNILERIRKGSFVPKHTFDVFSKMVFDKNPGDFGRWTIDNIQHHKLIIKDCIDSLNLV